MDLESFTISFVYVIALYLTLIKKTVAVTAVVLYDATQD